MFIIGGVIESSRYSVKFELDSIEKLKARIQLSFFFFKCSKLNSIKLESIKKFINNYTRA